MQKIPIHQWEGCYEETWNGIIVPASFAHPAKLSRSLIQKIYAYMIDREWISRGSIVGDCFGGVACGGIPAAYLGLHWIGVELEENFCKLGNENLSKHRPNWETMKLGSACLIQGDSRNFATLIDASVTAIISSPPYSSINPAKNSGTVDLKKMYETYRASGGGASFKKFVATQEKHSQGYGNSDGQISALKDGGLDSVISSPPFRDARSETTKPTVTKKGGPCAERHCATSSGVGYGKTEGQIDNLKTGKLDGVIGSPPYAQSIRGLEHNGIDVDKLNANNNHAGKNSLASSKEIYGKSPGQIARLKEGKLSSIVSSPPWEANAEGGIKAHKMKFVPDNGKGHYATPAAKARAMEKEEAKVYGDSPGQIGKTQAEDYWQACAAVYRSCFEALKPGGMCALVVKDYIKAKKRVHLCDDTCRLLEHVGFIMVERIHAMLVKDVTNPDLFEGAITKRTERKSFFKRLYEKKAGSIRIDWEEVLICQKPYETAFS